VIYSFLLVFLGGVIIGFILGAVTACVPEEGE
jgi:gas vesicle protein